MAFADMTGCLTAGANFIDVDLTKVKRSAADAKIIVGPDRRATTRYTAPKIFVKTRLGAFATINWSFSGVCLSYNAHERLVPDSIVAAKIVAEGQPPPRDANFIVVRDDPVRGIAMLKFTDMDEALSEYLKSVVPV